MKKSAQLRQQALAKLKEADGILKAAEGKDGDEFAAELAKATALKAEHDSLMAQAAEIEQIENTLSTVGQPVNTVGLAPAPEVGKPNFLQDPKRGFKSPREFTASVIEAGVRGRTNDERLRSLAAGADEQGGYGDEVGGFLIPEAFAPNMMETSWEGDPVADLVTRVPMEAPTVKIPARVDKDHSTSVSGGFRVYRRNETDDVTPSRQKYELVALEAESLMGVAYATEELLTDSPVSFAAIIEAGMQTELGSKISGERISGTGVGQFLGVLNSPCLISVAKEGSQSADTINSTNVIKMRKQIWGYENAIWLANNDTYDQLIGLHIAGTHGDVFLFAPGNGTDKPDTLLGRPIKFTDEVPTVGDLGDIILGNWSQYLEGVYQQSEVASSVHVRFVNNERAFRVTMRNAGGPWWRSALTPKKSAVTRSPFVALAAR